MKLSIVALTAALACSGSYAFAQVVKHATPTVRHRSETPAFQRWFNEHRFASPGMTTGSAMLRGPKSRSASEDAGVNQMDSTPSGE